jgi:hypothetical protein
VEPTYFPTVSLLRMEEHTQLAFQAHFVYVKGQGLAQTPPHCSVPSNTPEHRRPYSAKNCSVCYGSFWTLFAHLLSLGGPANPRPSLGGPLVNPVGLWPLSPNGGAPPGMPGGGPGWRPSRPAASAGLPPSSAKKLWYSLSIWWPTLVFCKKQILYEIKLF